MNIVLDFGPGTSDAPAGFQSALAMAASVLDSALPSQITVTIAINYQPIGGSDIGYASANFAGALAPYGQVISELATTATPSGFLADLPAVDPTNGVGLRVSTSQQKAFGLLDPSNGLVDGEATFDSSTVWSYGGAVPAGSYDLVGVALHELTHALGRLDGGSTGMALISYNDTTHQLDTTPADARYFSVDGGVTNLAAFDSSSDPGDLTTATADPFDAYFQPGEAYTWTPLDTEMMDALGFGGPAVTDITPSLAQTGLRFIGPATTPTVYSARASGSPNVTTNLTLHSGDSVQLWGMTPADLASGAVTLNANCLYSVDPALPRVVLAGSNILNTTVTQQPGFTLVQEH